MQGKIRIGEYQLQWSLGRFQKVRGICSNLPDGNHFLMWDFDTTDWHAVYRALTGVRDEFNLPSIHIVQSRRNSGFHAYCFKRVTWEDCQVIINRTPLVDVGYYKLGVLRGYYTLRITPKVRQSGEAEGFAHVTDVVGFALPDVDPREAMTEVTYWTKRS